MIDRHYGHLARDGREHAIRLLDTLNQSVLDPAVDVVDAPWTPPRANPAREDNKTAR
jgi:hypothetical protein